MKNKIVIAEGQEHEKTIYLENPKGKMARKIIPKVLDFMDKLQKSQEEGDQEAETLAGIVRMLNVFWDEDEFEEVIAPFVLQLNTPEGRKYLEENVTVGEMISAFTQAANYLIEASFGREDVQEAVGKSAVEAREARRKRK